MGLCGGQSGTQTVTEKADPWGPLQPYLAQYYSDASNWLRNPYLGTPVDLYGASMNMPANPATAPAQAPVQAPAQNTPPSPSGILKPYADLSPYVNKMLNSRSVSGAGSFPQVPPSPTGGLSAPVAGIPPETAAAWGLTTQRALEGSPVSNAAQQGALDTLSGMGLYSDPSMAFLLPTASGAMLNQNPWLDTMFGRAAGQVGEQFQNITMPAIASRFGMAGRTGSGAEQDMYGRAMRELGTSLSDMAANLYGTDYSQERQRQLAAATGLSTPYQAERQRMLGMTGLAPGLAGLDYADLEALAGVGAQRRGYASELINAPMERLMTYSSMLQPGSNFLSSTQTSPLYSNPLAGALGGIAGGAGLAGTLGGPFTNAAGALGPWGWGLAGIGGLLGAFG